MFQKPVKYTRMALAFPFLATAILVGSVALICYLAFIRVMP